MSKNSHKCKKCADAETPLDPKPAVTFDTIDEYEAQCERMRQCGIDDASRAVWKAVKKEAELFWKLEASIRDESANPACDLRAASWNNKFITTLDAYDNAFKAMGGHLTYVLDCGDQCDRVHTIKATGIYGNTLGYLRDYGKDKWWA